MRLPTSMSLDLAQASSSTVWLSSSDDRVSGEPSSQSSESTSDTFFGSTADTRTSLPPHHPAGEGQRGDRLHALRPGRLAAGARADRREAVGVLEDEVALEVAVDRVAHRGADAGGEDRDEDHHGQADHQRARGDRGAARLAHRVLARQAPGDAAELLERPAADRGERAHELGAEHRDAEAAWPPRRRPRAPPRRWRRRCRRTGRRRSCRCPRSTSSTATPVKMRPRVRLSGSSASSSAAIGVTRVARSAGTRAAASVTKMPTTSATMIVRLATTVPVLGRSMPKALEHGPEARGEPDPGRHAESRAEHAEQQRLEDHPAEDLAAARRRACAAARTRGSAARP